ncbi:MAG: ABC transporter ATP-binding protein [Bacteroidales bacterium]|nr:ABC transporter ATP-binding protein [Bacteroidales bacterium]MDD3010874.1 ABC transporter ATP-binding protein [Bacteroidales bacterium]MDY0287158.1 ABC transporter ATP-binding protein [Bacteroidales bacterium]HPE87508.1 ABC transporter ATP-binding protein [Bacteroidales bacterium]
MKNRAEIVAEQITRSYGTTVALDHIVMEVEKGEIFGLIGPDGAGKSTLFRIFTTLLLPDSGKATVMGYDCVADYKAIRNRIGYMPGRFSLYQDLTVEENLTFYATVFKTTVKENYDIIRNIYSQIEPFKNRRAGKLSGGMKQKLALSCALVHRPEIIFLDEPTTGVDAVSRKEFWEILNGLKEKGITILVSTPYMDEAVRCDRVGFIQNGQLFRIGEPRQIIRSFPRKVFDISTSAPQKLFLALSKALGTHSVFRFGGTLHVYGDASLQVFLTAFATNHPDLQISVHETEAGIEDCFIELMKAPPTAAEAK